MRFLLTWVTIEACCALAWTIVATRDEIRFHVDRAIHFTRSSSPSEKTSDPIGYLWTLREDAISKALQKDDEDVTGFAPPRALRLLIASAIVFKEFVYIATSLHGQVVSSATERLGQLACLNILPLIILGFPSAVANHVMQQSSPHLAWAHHLYGWMIWFEGLLHGLSHLLLSSSNNGKPLRHQV